MASGTFTTEALIHIWRRATLDASELPEPVTFDSREVDLDIRVALTPDEDTLQATLWNIGTPQTVMPLLRDGYLIAIDMARRSAGMEAVEGPPIRVVLGRISGRRVLESEEDGDIGFQVDGVSLTEALQEVHLQVNFLADEGPWRARDIAREILRLIGMGFVQVDIPEDWFVDAFTADGPVFSVLKRLAGKAGRPMGIWMQGARVTISDHFTPGHVVSSREVISADPDDQVALVQPIIPISPPENQEVGEPFDYGSILEDSSEEMQIARSSAPVGNSFKLVLPLAPEVVRGEVLQVEGEDVLARLNIFGVKSQAFNVHGVTHIFSSREDAPMDTTELIVGTREESE